VIFENFEATLRITLSETENTLSKTKPSLSKSEVFLELPLMSPTRATKWKWGNSLQQYSRWDAFYLFSSQGISGMLQGEILVFYRTFVLLRSHIFASIEKFGLHLWYVANESPNWLTQIYLYRLYIPDLIRLANGIETNPGPAVVDNIWRQ